MKLTERLRRAIDLAARLHNGQVRKTADVLPYISHPFAVAWIVAQYTDDEDSIIAALMHDTLEDVKGYTMEQLISDCGQRVADIVKGVSEEKSLPFEKRKQLYIETIKQGSLESMMICAADKIHNMRSMMEAAEKEGEEFWNRFHGGDDTRREFFGAVLETVKNTFDHPIIAELEKTYNDFCAALEPAT